MYASLISAGASTLFDLVKSATSSSSATAANTAAPAFPDDASTTIPTTTKANPVNAAGDTGSKVSDAVRNLFVDLQAGTDAAAPTGTVGKDVGALRKAAGAGHGSGVHGAHGHANPLSALTAYAKTQALNTSTATALAA